MADFQNDPACHSDPPPSEPDETPGAPGAATYPDPTQLPPDWIPFCSGGADYLSAADPVDPEEWTF